MKSCSRTAPLFLFFLGFLGGCNAGGSGGGATPPSGSRGGGATAAIGRIGPGKIVTTQDGGQIFGFDADQSGNDGVLASSQTLGTNLYKVSVETFSTTTGKITKSFAQYTGKRNSYTVQGIFANDVALVTHYVEPKKSIYAKRFYDVMNPVTAEKFTGKWTPPIRDADVQMKADNQNTTTSVVFAIELKNQDVPDLFVSDIATNTFSKVIHLDPNAFGLANSPQLSQDSVNSLAVMAVSPDGGAAGGPPPNIVTIDLKSGSSKQFAGVDCPGSARCGAPNGIGYDSATGIACTTTEIDGGIEFYSVAQRTGIHEFLPNAGQFYSGAYVANDPIHKLFLVAQPQSSTGPSNSSSVQVYDEQGNFVESVNGLNFTFNSYSVIPVRIALNPSKRQGWVNGPTVRQLQEFTY
jgi:hypothetical protein